MATITDNKNGALTVVLTAEEQLTFAGLPLDQLQNYVTLWLADHASDIFQSRFNNLSPVDKVDVLAKMAAADLIKKAGAIG